MHQIFGCSGSLQANIVHHINLHPDDYHRWSYHDLSCQQVWLTFLYTSGPSTILLFSPLSPSPLPFYVISSVSSSDAVGNSPSDLPAAFMRGTFYSRLASPSSPCRFAWPLSDESLQLLWTGSKLNCSRSNVKWQQKQARYSKMQRTHITSRKHQHRLHASFFWQPWLTTHCWHASGVLHQNTGYIYEHVFKTYELDLVIAAASK